MHTKKLCPSTYPFTNSTCNRIFLNFNNKYVVQILLSLSLILYLSTANAQYFNVSGDWAGNDANGNAVIKWEIEICAGSTALESLQWFLEWRLDSLSSI